MSTGKTVLAAAASLLFTLLLLGKDLLELCQRLVPRLGQGCQGKGCPKQEGAGVEEEYALHPDQGGQKGERLKGIGLKWPIMDLVSAPSTGP